MNRRIVSVSVAFLAALAFAAACSSSNTATGTCDAEVPCFQVDDAGYCSNEKASSPCQSCPAGYVTSDKCTPPPVDSGTDAGQEGPSGDAEPDTLSCGVISTCFPLPDSGVGCGGASVLSGPCAPCPTGYSPTDECGDSGPAK